MKLFNILKPNNSIPPNSPIRGWIIIVMAMLVSYKLFAHVNYSALTVSLIVNKIYQGVLCLFMFYSGIKYLRSYQFKMPLRDEYEKKIEYKAGYITLIISLFLLMFIPLDFFNIGISNDIIVQWAFPVILMIFLTVYFYYKLFGFKNE